MRYRVFKERLDWDVPVHAGLERDEFDDMDPTYILAFNGDDVVGSWRLLPTTGPTMVGSVFSELLDGQRLPSRPDVWECSRFAVDCDRGRTDSLCSVSNITCQIFCGLIEFCISERVREIVSVYDIGIARMLPRIGCLPHWQGRFQRIGKSKAVAGRFYATPELLEVVQQRVGIEGPVLRSSRLPLAADPHLYQPMEVSHVQ